MPIIAGELIPAGSTFAAVDDLYIEGGYKCVANTTERDAIPTSRRKVGMRVYDLSTDKQYILFGGTANGNWTEVVRSGTVPPESNVLGLWVGQTYAQFATIGDGSALTRLWVFNGVPGNGTGWA